MPPSGTAPIRDIVAPVRDIVVPTADLEGAARVDESEKQLKVRLSSEVLFPKDSARLRPAVHGRLIELAEGLDRRGPGRVTIVATPMTAALLTMVWFSLVDELPLWRTCSDRGWTRPITPSESPAVARPTRRCPTPLKRTAS